MAKIRLDLSQFKASGIYTIEFDQSESIVLNTQTTRLVVGFSKKGPINAPVFCQDVKAARRIFGDIDTSLEARGSFFHRSLFTCLETGPCFALALMPLNNDTESANPDYDKFKSFSLSLTENNGELVDKLFSSYFNKERFYFPDGSYFLANVENSINEGKLLSFVNLGQIPFSVIVRKTGDLAGFNVTARDWFGAGNVPTYIREFDFISEYFVQVDIVQGDWTNLQMLSVDPVFSQYFDAKGLKADKIQAFLNAPDVISIGSFQGCLIPDLVDGNGVNYSIDTIINNNVATTGLFVALDRAALSNYDPDQVSANGRVDVIGHTLIDSNNDIVNFLSYNFPVKDKIDFLETTSFAEETVNFGASAIGATNGWNYDYTGLKTTQAAYYESYFGQGNEGKFNNILTVEKQYLDSQDLAYLSSLTPGQSLFAEDGVGGTGAKYATITSIIENTDRFKFAISHPDKATEGNNSYILSSISVGGNQIIIPGTANSINPGDWIFASRNNLRYYFRVVDVTVTTVTALEVDVLNFDGQSNFDSLVSATSAVFLPTSGWRVFYGSNFDVVGGSAGNEGITGVAVPDLVQYIGATGGYYEAYEGSNLYKDFTSGILTNGDKVYVAGPLELYVSGEFTRDAINNIKILKLNAWSDTAFTLPYTGDWTFANIRDNANASIAGSPLRIYSLTGDYELTISN